MRQLRGFMMKRFIEGVDRHQVTLFPEQLEDWVGDDNPVRVIDVFVDELDLGDLGFARVVPRETGRPGYQPWVLLKLYIYGYLNRVQSSRRLEREAGRNVEVMWLVGRWLLSTCLSSGIVISPTSPVGEPQSIRPGLNGAGDLLIRFEPRDIR